MFRETSPTASEIIELIQALPEKEQKIIARKLISASRKKAVKPQKKNDSAYLKKIETFQKYVAGHRFNLPPQYKFDREEANAR